jgi:hypothetical protein
VCLGAAAPRRGRSRANALHSGLADALDRYSEYSVLQRDHSTERTFGAGRGQARLVQRVRLQRRLVDVEV